MARHPLGCFPLFLGSAHPRVSGGYTQDVFSGGCCCWGFFFFMFSSFSVSAPCSHLDISYLCTGLSWLFSLATTLSGIMLEWLLQRGFVSKSPCH